MNSLHDGVKTLGNFVDGSDVETVPCYTFFSHTFYTIITGIGCQVTHVTDLMFIMFLCLFNNQIVSVAHSRVTFWLPPRCEPV